jgi:TatD DNase family protein
MKYINLHTHQYTGNEAVIEIVNQYPREFEETIPYYSIGIHPWHIDENQIEADLKIIESKLDGKACLAIGECGLDKRIDISFALQIQVFEAQLALAEKYRKPVIIHCVAAFSEVIQIKKQLNVTVPMIIHGFSKNEQTAKQLLDNGFYLSFGKYLLRNPALESVFKSIPNDRFFLETDTIEETIADVYTLATKYKSLSLQALQEMIDGNFEIVFQINKSTNPQINK